MKKEEFKNYNIICTNEKEVRECMSILEKLGFDVEKQILLEKDEIIVKYYLFGNSFAVSVSSYEGYKNMSFYKFKKEANKILKEEKNKLKDIEVASDGRIIKINDEKSKREIFIACDVEHRKQGIEIRFITPFYLKYILKYGLVYATEEARDKARFKLEIETKLKNIAERLNNREKIDWNNNEQCKYYIYYDFKRKTLDFDYSLCHKQQGTIYCLSEDFFFDEAKKEIGEENLIKYFKEC